MKVKVILKKIIVLLTIMLITTTLVSAIEVVDDSIPTITPDSRFYDIKLWFEDLQEKLTFNEAKKLSLRQEHLQNRLNELRHEAVNNYNKNTEKILQKIHIKQFEIEEILEGMTQEPGFSNIIEIYPEIRRKYTTCDNNGICSSSVSELQFINDIKRSNIEVLTNLLNDGSMPEQSRKGLENALNNTMKYLKVSVKNSDDKPKIVNINVPNTINEEDVEISANMVQGTYSVNPKYLSILPFTNVAVFDPNENKWYSIVIEDNKVITILNYLTKDTPQYYLYPTSSQIKSLEEISLRINKDGITTKDKIQLLKLWYSIKKEENK